MIMVGENDALTAPYVILQLVTLGIWAIALLTLPWQPRSPVMWRSAVALASVSELIAPVAWYKIVPPFSGIEGAGRLILGVAFAGVSGILSCFWALGHKWKTLRRLTVPWAFLALMLGSLLVWFALCS